MLRNFERNIKGNYIIAVFIGAFICASHASASSFTFKKINDAGAPALGPCRESSAWGGAEFFRYGVCLNGEPVAEKAIWIYNASSDAWRTSTTEGALKGRTNSLLAWAGQELLMWGGCYADVIPGNPPSAVCPYTNEGTIYNPTNDTFRIMPTQGAPSGRLSAIASWTGSQFIVWGGTKKSGDDLVDGAIFDPATNKWKAISTDGAVYRRRAQGHWTGTHLLVWGGYDEGGYQESGALYDPTTDKWSPISPYKLSCETMIDSVWTGSEMIVTGRVDGTDQICGAIYNTERDEWRAMDTTGAPLASFPSSRSLIWNGAKVVAFGGATMKKPIEGLSFFEPASQKWSRAEQPYSVHFWGHKAYITQFGMFLFGASNLGVPAGGFVNW